MDKSKYHKTKEGKMARKVCTIILTNEKKRVLQEVNLNLLYLRNLIRVCYLVLKSNFISNLLLVFHYSLYHK
jgi:hypothetical protein